MGVESTLPFGITEPELRVLQGFDYRTADGPPITLGPQARGVRDFLAWVDGLPYLAKFNAVRQFAAKLRLRLLGQGSTVVRVTPRYVRLLAGRHGHAPLDRLHGAVAAGTPAEPEPAQSGPLLPAATEARPPPTLGPAAGHVVAQPELVRGPTTRPVRFPYPGPAVGRVRTTGRAAES